MSSTCSSLLQHDPEVAGDALFPGLLWLFNFMNEDPQGHSRVPEAQVCGAGSGLRFEAIGVRVGGSVTP